ncbi:unnamed protein product [Amoebophrya sp. A25]|nr:unnamed protein product [Amoebophrya sp. A25]|eukprot:GSA25T00005815001.1
MSSFSLLRLALIGLLLLCRRTVAAVFGSRGGRLISKSLAPLSGRLSGRQFSTGSSGSRPPVLPWTRYLKEPRKDRNGNKWKEEQVSSIQEPRRSPVSALQKNISPAAAPPPPPPSTPPPRSTPPPHPVEAYASGEFQAGVPAVGSANPIRDEIRYRRHALGEKGFGASSILKGNGNSDHPRRPTTQGEYFVVEESIRQSPGAEAEALQLKERADIIARRWSEWQRRLDDYAKSQVRMAHVRSSGDYFFMRNAWTDRKEKVETMHKNVRQFLDNEAVGIMRAGYAQMDKVSARWPQQWQERAERFERQWAEVKDIDDRLIQKLLEVQKSPEDLAALSRALYKWTKQLPPPRKGRFQCSSTSSWGSSFEQSRSGADRRGGVDKTSEDSSKPLWIEALDELTYRASDGVQVLSEPERQELAHAMWRRMHLVRALTQQTMNMRYRILDWTTQCDRVWTATLDDGLKKTKNSLFSYTASQNIPTAFPTGYGTGPPGQLAVTAGHEVEWWLPGDADERAREAREGAGNDLTLPQNQQKGPISLAEFVCSPAGELGGPVTATNINTSTIGEVEDVEQLKLLCDDQGDENQSEEAGDLVSSPVDDDEEFVDLSNASWRHLKEEVNEVKEEGFISPEEFSKLLKDFGTTNLSGLINQDENVEDIPEEKSQSGDMKDSEEVPLGKNTTTGTNPTSTRARPSTEKHIAPSAEHLNRFRFDSRGRGARLNVARPAYCIETITALDHRHNLASTPLSKTKVQQQRKVVSQPSYGNIRAVSGGRTHMPKRALPRTRGFSKQSYVGGK